MITNLRIFGKRGRVHGSRRTAQGRRLKTVDSGLWKLPDIAHYEFNIKVSAGKVPLPGGVRGGLEQD